MAFLTALLPLCGQVQVIPQVADGGGWSTTIVLSNKTASAQNVTLRFNRGTTNGATEPWTPTFVPSVALPTLNLPAGSSLFLRTPGTAANVSQGWGELDAPAGVVGYAIFTFNGQDATAPAVSAATRILVPFDNSPGFASALAVVNPGTSALVVQVNVRTTDGTTTSSVLPSLPAKGQRTFLMRDVFPSTEGRRGLAEFYVASGSFSMIALRANPTNAFTSAPVYFQTGQPIIGGGATSPPAGQAQVQVIPQVADGAGWSTTIVLTNTTTSNLTGSLTFRQATGAGATAAWNPAFLDNANTSNLNIPAGSALFLRTPGTATGLTQGWAELTASPGIVGYAIFTSKTAGKPDQDATAPAVSSTGRLLIPFDNESGLQTAVAIVNPGMNTQTINVNFRTVDGTTTTGSTFDLPSRGQLAVLMPAQFSGTAGKRGLAEFYVASGSVALIALRASPSGAFTSAPAYFESGAPIITGGGGGGTGGGGTGGGGGGGTGGGGGSNNTDPSQEEVDRWIAQGNYRTGIVSLTRSTAYATTDNLGGTGTTTTMTKQDTFSAQFTRTSGADLAKSLRGEFPPGYPDLTPTVGGCVVYNSLNLTNPFPNLTVTGLDAGPQITSSGPNGNQAATRQSLPGLGFSYNADNVPNTYLAPGRYTITGPGGADVGSFSGTLDIGQEFTVTSNPDDFKVINRANGVTVRWSGGEPSAIVTISGGSVVIGAGTGQSAAFVCLQNASAGQFTVPGSILSQLPASTVIGAGGFNLVTRGSFSVSAPGAGVRFSTPSGLDILTAFNFWTWTYTPQYQ